MGVVSVLLPSDAFFFPPFVPSAHAQFDSGRSRDSVFQSNTGARRSRGRSGSRSQRDDLPPTEEGYPPAPASETGEAAPIQQQQQVVPQQQAGPPAQQRPAPSSAVRRPVSVPRPGGPPQSGKQPSKPEETKTGIPPEGQIILRVVPVELKADVGEDFPVHIWLDNPEERKFDVVSLALSFDPNLIEFVDAPGGEEGQPNAYDSSEKSLHAFNLVRDPREDPFYLNRADAENGFVYYRTRCASGTLCAGEGFLLSMKFKALGSVDRTRLGFVFSDWPIDLSAPIQSDQTWDWPETMTFVGRIAAPGSEGKAQFNLLGDEGSKADGVISANFALRAYNAEEILENKVRVPEGRTDTRLWLDPPLTSIQAGKTFDVNVVLDNPNRIPWDRVRLDIGFDDRYLEVVDQDEGNWLKYGTNILDGPYHDRFPFEFLRENQARNDSGLIRYDCMVFQKPLQASGVFATIRFRALNQTPETRIVLRQVTEKGSKEGTRLMLKRADVLGDTKDPLDGVSGVSVVIVPRAELLSARNVEADADRKKW